MKVYLDSVSYSKLVVIIQATKTRHIFCKINFLGLLFFLFSSCASIPIKETDYRLNVGAIVFDKSIDDAKFKVCNENQIVEYYNFGKGFQYKGEKYALMQVFKETLNSKKIYKESGYITLRFIVNCIGYSGRFRVQEMDMNYHSKRFRKDLVASLLAITSRLDGWVIGEANGKKFDYYQYITFKIVDGVLIEIKP